MRLFIGAMMAGLFLAGCTSSEDEAATPGSEASETPQTENKGPETPKTVEHVVSGDHGALTDHDLGPDGVTYEVDQDGDMKPDTVFTDIGNDGSIDTVTPAP